MLQAAKPSSLEKINRHIESENFRKDRLWQFRNGQFFTDVDGKLISEETFNLLYPVYVPVSYRNTRENIDSKSNWIS